MNTSSKNIYFTSINLFFIIKKEVEFEKDLSLIPIKKRNQKKLSWSIIYQPSELTRMVLSSQIISLAQLSKSYHISLIWF